MNNYDVFAFDIGGVLAYQDLSSLSKEELKYLQVFMNRFKNPNDRLLDQAKKYMQDIYLKIHHLNPDTLPTLDFLYSRDIRTSIWTNNIKEIEPWLAESGIYRYVNRRDVINSFDIGYDKPNACFFYKALKILDVHPSKVIFFDDNQVNVIGAKRCGIDSQMFEMHKSLRLEIAKYFDKGDQL